MGFFGSRKKTTAEVPRRSLWLAMVALDRPTPWATGALLAFLQDHWKDVPRAHNVREDRDTLSFELESITVTLARMPAPIPWSDLERPARAAWHWPDAVERLQAHTAHFIVAVHAPGVAPLDAALLLTRVVAAATATHDACGIYWGEGPVVNAPDDFIDEALKGSREHLPLYLWLAFHLEREPDHSFTLRTSGLRAFGLMELEVVASREKPAMLVDRAFTFAHYLLDHGPVLRDGDTIGLSAQERLRVRHLPSVHEPARKVYRVEP
ncbi:DUF4261 domain-containing protein [Myxococcaceae bacterium GXIMD 01537]